MYMFYNFFICLKENYREKETKTAYIYCFTPFPKWPRMGHVEVKSLPTSLTRGQEPRDLDHLLLLSHA